MRVSPGFFIHFSNNIDVTRSATINNKPHRPLISFCYTNLWPEAFSYNPFFRSKTMQAKTGNKASAGIPSYSNNYLIHIFRGLLFSLLLTGLLEFIGQFITRGI